MKKVLFLIPSLGGGGAERVFSCILRHIDRALFEPRLVVFEKKGEYLADIPSDIAIDTLRENPGKNALYGSVAPLLAWRFAKLLRKERPDTVVSFMWYSNMVALLAKSLSGMKFPLIVSERYGFSVSHEGQMVEFLRRSVVRLLYPKADSLIVNSQEMGFQLERSFNIDPEKVKVIYNPVYIQGIAAAGSEEAEHPWYKETTPVIVAAGRLSKQKGFAYLIRAVAILNAAHVPCRLIILGEGSEKKGLQDLAEELGIADRVAFPGFKKNPYHYMANAALFVLSSLYEGFPNVLLEAQALGVPCVATRCPTGPDEIITDGVNGLLVPPGDEKALAAAIKRLLGDVELRKKFSDAGRKKAEEFRVEKIVKQYEDLIERVCAGSAEK